MTKKIIIKIFSVLLLTVIISTSFCTYDVKAVSLKNETINSQELVSELNNSNEEIAKEEKIMKYDVKTGTTTEIDIEQISALLRKANINVAEPYGNIATSKNSNNVPVVLADGYGMTQVTNTTSFPYKATCRLTWNGGGFATGFLVGPNLLLTAAHCVMKTSPSDAFANWKCYPAYNGGQVAINGTTHSTGWEEIYYSNNWVNYKSNDYDWCLCVLENDLGNDIGAYYGVQAYGSNSGLNNVAVKALGYPGQNVYDGLYQRYSTGTTSNTHARYFDCSARSFEGMSGGPIMRTSDNYVVGLVKGAYKNNTSKTYGVRMTQAIVDLINDLR